MMTRVFTYKHFRRAQTHPLSSTLTRSCRYVCVCVSVCARARSCENAPRSRGWRSARLPSHFQPGVRGGSRARSELPHGSTGVGGGGRAERPSPFCFHLARRTTPHRIYENTRVDLYHHFKPEGMPVFFARLTFLWSLVALTRGEWRAGILSLSLSPLLRMQVLGSQ